MRDTNQTKAILIRVPTWAHTTLKTQAARTRTSIQAVTAPALVALAEALGGRPDAGANPSLAQSGQPQAGPGVSQRSPMD